MDSIKEITKKMKIQSPVMAGISIEDRNKALDSVRKILLQHQNEIFTANQKDLLTAQKEEIAPAVLKRLKFDEDKLAAVISGIDSLIGLPDPIGQLLLARELDKGLTLYRQTCPIGVIGVIFEARPDALIQISTLCLKSGNCAILKGGSETLHTNKIPVSYTHLTLPTTERV